MSPGKQLPPFRWYQRNVGIYLLKKWRNFLGDLNPQNFENWSPYSPCSKVLQKLEVYQLFTKFPAIYGTRRFITAITSTHHLSVFSARSIQSMPPTHFLKIHFNVLIPSTPRSTKWSASLRSHHQNTAPLLSPTRTTCLADLILPDLITRTIVGEKYRALSPSLCGLLHCPVTSSLVGTNTFLRTLLATTLSYVPRRILHEQLQGGGKEEATLRSSLKSYKQINIYNFRSNFQHNSHHLR